jgi:polyisoprenoid-binding protein YceI
MKLLKTIGLYTCSFLLAGMMTSAVASDWYVDNTKSTLSFISIKKEHVAEVHQFDIVSGVLDSTGHLIVAVELDSVNTNAPFRDEALEKLLFEVSRFANARIIAQVEPKLFSDLPIGQTRELNADAKLDLHGEQQELKLELLVTRLAEDRLTVMSVKPVILNVADYALLEGIEKLKELVSLDSISHAVPVTFYFNFVKK